MIYSSANYDFSFLRIKSPQKLLPIKWADSSKATIGQNILTITSTSSVNEILLGRITSLIYTKNHKKIQYIETNLNLYKGDSGSPIIDHQGRLLGIIMAKQKHKEQSSIAIASNVIHQKSLIYK